MYEVIRVREARSGIQKKQKHWMKKKLKESVKMHYAATHLIDWLEAHGQVGLDSDQQQESAGGRLKKVTEQYFCNIFYITQPGSMTFCSTVFLARFLFAGGR